MKILFAVIDECGFAVDYFIIICFFTIFCGTFFSYTHSTAVVVRARGLDSLDARARHGHDAGGRFDDDLGTGFDYRFDARAGKFQGAG